MEVAIIDDEQSVREELEGYIERFSEEAGISMRTTLFSSGDSFFEQYKMIYDILIFDIDMPGTNGMDTARKIREIDKKVTIIFITNFAQYAINGYEVDAVDYIIKPIGYYDFSMKFYRTVAKAAQKQENIIKITTTDGTRRLRVNTIVYVEILSHYLYFHTIKNVYKARGNMQEIDAELSKYNFVRIHRSYIINLRFVDKVLTKEVTLKEQVLPVGRNYKDKLKQEYMRYIRGEE